METKRTKMMEEEEEEEEEDRISALQDCLIQHIISFLPSTKQAIQTCILSKRWRNQWTCVPVLIFKSNSTSSEQVLKLIENALVLHDCYKIKIFHLDYYYYLENADQFTSKIRFATRKHVEDLYLSSAEDRYMLPKFLFKCASLVKLTTQNCHFMPRGKVHWGCLTALNIENCNFTDEALERIICGSPLLESLEVSNCEYPSDNLVIASKSMKRLVLEQLAIMEINNFEISCPNLEELCLKGISIDDPKEFGQAIEHVLFGCSFLKSFSLDNCYNIEHLVIASKSLKRLILGRLHFILHIEISCPKLEVLDILDCFNIGSVKLLNLPALIYASIEFYHDWELERSTQEHGSLIKDTLQQLHHVEELSLGNWFMKILSAIEVGCLFSPVLNTRCLTLNYVHLNERHSGIACVLRNSPMLEELVIKLPCYGELHGDLPELNDFGENCWKSDMNAYGCLVSHLKTIRIIGYPKRDDKRKFVLNFVRFLLKNARVLEKMVLEWKGHETAFPFKVSQELLSLPRCSQYAIIELLCSNK